MSAYEPPTQNLAIFDPDVFTQNDEPLTITTGSKYFLKYPNAQGTENLQAVNVNGVLTANSATDLNGTLFVSGTSTFEDTITLSSTTANNRRVSSSYYDITDINGNVNRTSEIYQNSQILTLTNEATSGRTRFINSTSGDVPTTIYELDTTNASLKRPLFMNDTTSATNRSVASSFYNFYDSAVAGTITSNGTLHNQSGSMFLQNTTNGGTINFVLNDAGGVQNTPLQLLTTGNLSNRTLTISANNNLQMNSGTGFINQPIVANDVSTQNNLRRTACSFTSGVSTGTGTSAFDCFDNTTSRGLFILPSAESGSLGDTSVRGDCVIGSRIQNGGAITISNWNTNMRNGLRVFTTDISNCGVRLQCGQNTGNAYTELAMDYNRTSNTTTTTFNNAINFNPTTPSATNSSRRLLSGLGTLSFTDISGNNSTNGTFNSRIWSDSSLTTGLGTGMFYDCSMGGLCGHTFRVSDGAGNKINALSVNSTALTSRESLTFASTAVADRNINNVGTLNFLDLSGNTTQGTTISNIYTDSTLVGGIGGMYYQNNINSGYHIFQARDASGVLTSPIYYGSALTSVSNTFVVRNDAITSNRLDIFGDTSQNTYVRGRTSTFSTNAHIHFQCDFRGAIGSVITNDVLNFTPTAVNYRRPIQFNYLTTPSAVNQLGFLVGTQMTSVNVATSANIRNITTYTFTSAGTYLINWCVYSNMNSGTATFTDFEIGVANSATNTFDTYTQTFTSYKNLIRAYPTLTTTSDLYEPTSCVYVASNGSIAYFNYLANYTGGTNIIIGGYYTITRIG